MLKQRMSLIALGILSASTAMANDQEQSKGFVEDSHLNIAARNAYISRDYKNGKQDKAEWGQGFIGKFESGFTQGTVGVGVDAHSLSSIKLDTGKGRAGIGQFSKNGAGEAEDTQSEVGGAIKFRISDTVLKYGNQIVASPVFSTDDARILPEVATGTLVTSNEIEGLELTAGRFTAISRQTATGRDGRELTEANIVGASYSFTENFSGAIHASDVEDHLKKKYINLNYNLPLAEEQALNFDFNAYKTDDDGRKLSGEIDNKIWSLAAAYSLGAHTFTVAHQRSSGDTSYNYGIDGGGTIYLANSIQYSDFDRKDERSWQARYDIDMETYGVPGLSFMARYVTGDNIDYGVGVDEGEENEFNFETKYVIQEGAAKDLSFRLRSAVYRANGAYNTDYTADNNDVRIIVEYPLSIL